MIAKGRNRDTAWYLDARQRMAGAQGSFERWLAPDNFTAEGRQKASLSAMNGVTE